MNQSNVAFAAVLLFAAVYICLAIAAYAHIRPEKKQSEMTRILAFTFWWAFYDVYDEPGKKLAKMGQVAFVLAIAANVAWITL